MGVPPLGKSDEAGLPGDPYVEPRGVRQDGGGGLDKVKIASFKTFFDGRKSKMKEL